MLFKFLLSILIFFLVDVVCNLSVFLMSIFSLQSIILDGVILGIALVLIYESLFSLVGVFRGNYINRHIVHIGIKKLIDFELSKLVNKYLKYKK